MARSAVVAVVVFIDMHIWHEALPRVLVGALDETGHLATALLIVSAWRPLRTYQRHLLVGALPAAVLIDLDHVPSEVFRSSVLTAGTYRPYSHSLIAILVVLAFSAVPRRTFTRLVIRGVSLGFALHLARDLPTGGVALLWPLTDHTVTYPYQLYLVLLFGAAVLPPLAATHRNTGMDRSGRLHQEPRRPPPSEETSSA